MTDGTAELSGPGNQQVYANVYRVGQDQGGNFSQFLAYIEYRGNGYGSFGISGNWAMALPGWNPGGSFFVPYERRFDNIGLWSGYFNVGHDANGYMNGFNWSAAISTDHDSVGGGTVYLSEGAAPRIPKKPSKPGTPTFSEVTPTSVRVSWTASTDNAGSAIDGYLLRQRAEAGDSGYTDVSQQNNLSRVVTGLTPGEDYTFSVYAHNGSADNGGYSLESTRATIQLPAGVFVSDGTAWHPHQLNVSDGAAWISQIPKVSTGSAWVSPA